MVDDPGGLGAQWLNDQKTAVFKLENMMVCLTAVSAVPQLIALAMVGGAGSGPRFMLAMFVEDVDAACSELARRGVVLLNGPVDRPVGGAYRHFHRPRRSYLADRPGSRCDVGNRPPGAALGPAPVFRSVTWQSS